MATVAGFLIIFVSILVSQSGYRNENISWFAVASLVVLNIINCKWVMNMAGNLKRSILFWGVFSFIFPPLALIILGTLIEKKPYENISGEHLSSKDNRVKLGDIYLEEEENTS